MGRKSKIGKSPAENSGGKSTLVAPVVTRPLNVLVVEDVENDALLLIRHLRKDGYDLNWQRVETPDALDVALRNAPWDLVICDYNLPAIDVPTVLNIIKNCGFDLPFIVVSGTIGEEKAAALMKAGAHDLILKGNLTRLVPAIERELKDAEERRAKAKADEQLDTERRLLDNLMANIPDAVYFRDLYHRYIRLNEAEAQVINTASVEAALGKRLDEVLPPHRAKLREEEENRIFATGDPLIDRIEKVPRDDGSMRWFSATKAPIRDRQGKIVGLVGITRDVTKRMEAEQALSASEAFFRATIDRAPAAIFITTLERRYQVVNKLACDWYATTAENIIGKNARDFVDADTAGRIQAQERRVIETKGPIEEELAIAYPDGVVRDVILQKYPILGPKGEILAVGTVIADLTAHKRMETALRAKTEQLEMVLESMDQGIYAVDRDLTCTLVNRRLAEIHGFPPELSHPGVKFEDLARFNASKGRYGPGEVEQHVRRRIEMARENRPMRYEFDLLDGRIVELRSNPLPNGGFVRTATDITELKQSEMALRQSEERFRAVLNSSPAAVTLKDRDGRYLLANRTFCAWMNSSADQIIGRTAFDLYPRKDAEEITENDGKVFAGGRTIIEERIRSFGDGSARNIVVHKCPILSADGQANAISITVSDITDIRQAANARKKSEQRLSGAIESLQEGFALFDKDDRIVAINEKYREMHPDAQDIMESGGTFEDLVRSIVARGLILDAKGREEEFTRERLERHRAPKGPIVLRFTDGSWRMIQESRTPEGGRALSYVDITELKRAEDEIRKLSSAVEQAPLGLIITDTKGAIEYVNAAFTELTGYDDKEAIGRNPRMLQSGRTPRETYREMWATITAGKAWRGTLTNKRKDGAIYPAATIISPITTADGTITHYVGAQEDITEQLAQQNILKQMEKIESLGSLAGGIAHDFNNMLLPIIALTKMTLKKLPEASEHRQRLEKVVQAAVRARDLVAQILRFSRREELKPEIVDTGEIMDEILGLLRTTLPSTIKTKYNRSPKRGLIFADAAQIGTVLLNLASNAADAMDGKPGELEFSLSRHVIGDEHLVGFENARAGPYVKISVRDTGHGMDEDTVKRIFEPFFTTKGVGKGTGLGLATAYGIITKHGGMVYVASEVGKGTTFDIYLPLVDDAKAGRPPADDARVARVRGSENAGALKG